jgi:hypothetical protein
MTTFQSGSAVTGGYYLDATTWHIEPVAHDGDRLPAGRGRWVRIPTAAALALVPVLGATFLMFLPLVGFALVLRAMAAPVVRLFQGSAAGLAATVSPGWQPGEAYFTGKGAAQARVEGPAQPDALDALFVEIQRRRSAR